MRVRTIIEWTIRSDFLGIQEFCFGFFYVDFNESIHFSIARILQILFKKVQTCFAHPFTSTILHDVDVCGHNVCDSKIKM